MRILFLTIKNENNLVDGKTANSLCELITRELPGSVLYGPGYRYESNDVMEILEDCGGQDKFDAVLFWLPERVLRGEPFGENIIEHYSIPPKLWSLPVNARSVRLPKLLCIGDFWHLCPSEWAYVFNHHGIDAVLSGNTFPFSSKQTWQHFFPIEVREKIPFIPYAGYFDPEICKNLGGERPYDVYMGGALVSNFYPVRIKMLQAFTNSALTLLIPGHPGYNFSKDKYKREIHPYVRSLNRSKISAFCSTHFNFPTMKLYEAMACGTLALCDPIHGAEHLGIIPDEHFIQADGTNCVEKAKYILNNPDKLKDMSDKAYSLVHERHTVGRRAKEIAEMLPVIFNGGKPVQWMGLSPNLALTRAHQRLMSRQEQKRISITNKSILDCELNVRQSTWSLWNRLAPMRFLPPEESEMTRIPQVLGARHLLMGHLDLLKAELMVKLANRLKPILIVEIGAKAGFYSMVMARWLHDENRDGNILAFTNEPHEEPYPFLTPFTLDYPYSRKALVEDLPGADKVKFIKKEQQNDITSEATRIDLILLNNQQTISEDFAWAKPFLHSKSVIIVDNYGVNSSKVTSKVNQFARENELQIEHIMALEDIPGIAACHF